MLTVEECRNKIASIERQIKKLTNPSPHEEEWIEQMKRLKIAYAIEMAKAIDRRDNGECEDCYS